MQKEENEKGGCQKVRNYKKMGNMKRKRRK
jgi:hypothetical protein